MDETNAGIISFILGGIIVMILGFSVLAGLLAWGIFYLILRNIPTQSRNTHERWHGQRFRSRHKHRR
jgi:hypothetical protein